MGKNKYRPGPGHDARNTGQVVRYFAERGGDTQIQSLPT